MKTNASWPMGMDCVLVYMMFGCSHGTQIPQPSEIWVQSAFGVVDKMETLPVSYFQSRYESAIVRHLRQFSEGPGSKGAASRLRLVPSAEGAGGGVLAAQVLRVGGSTEVRLRLSGLVRTIQLAGDRSPHLFLIRGHQYEIFGFDLNAQVRPSPSFRVNGPLVPNDEEGMEIIRYVKSAFSLPFLNMYVTVGKNGYRDVADASQGIWSADVGDLACKADDNHASCYVVSKVDGVDVFVHH